MDYRQKIIGNGEKYSYTESSDQAEPVLQAEHGKLLIITANTSILQVSTAVFKPFFFHHMKKVEICSEFDQEMCYDDTT